MVKKIGVTIATLAAAGAFGVTGVAGATQGSARSVAGECPSVCPQIYDPVVCKFSDGTVKKFGNRCFADVYACKRNLKIVGCKPAAA